MSNSYKLSDAVWARVVQIIQEAMLLGLDITDLLRMIRVVSKDGSDQLELSPEYESQVESMHAKWLEKARQLQAKETEPAPLTLKSN